VRVDLSALFIAFFPEPRIIYTTWWASKNIYEMYVNAKMIPVETIPGMGWGE
jgi:hypothetical protein